jgi:hypothetical protein
MFLNYDILQHIFDNSDYFTMLKLNKGLNKYLDIKRLKALTTIKKILNRKGIACERLGSHWIIYTCDTFQPCAEGTQYRFVANEYARTPQILTGISVFGKDITKITIQIINWTTLYVFHFVDANYVYINHLQVLLYKLGYTSLRIFVESKCTHKVAIHIQKEQNVIQSNYVQKWHTFVKVNDTIKQNELVYDTGICCLRYAS